MEKRTMAVVLDAELVSRIKEIARQERRSMSAQAGLLLEIGLSTHKGLDLSAGQARELAEAIGGGR